MIEIIFILTILILSMITADWAQKRLGKNYWEAFFISLLLSPLAFLVPFVRSLKASQNS